MGGQSGVGKRDGRASYFGRGSGRLDAVQRSPRSDWNLPRGGSGEPKRWCPHKLVLEDGETGTRDGGQVAVEVEAFGENDLENLGDVHGVLGGTVEQGSLHELCVLARLLSNVLLLFLGELLERIELGANHEGHSSLVQAASLTVPLLHGSQGNLTRQIEHEQDSSSLIAYQGQHVHELALA